MAHHMTQDWLQKAIQMHIAEDVKSLIEAEAEAAADRVRKHLKSKVAEIACAVASEYSVERMGADLRIVVKHVGGGL